MKLQFIDRERDDAWLLGQQIERGNNRFIGAEKSNLGLTANRLSHILVILYVYIHIYAFIYLYITTIDWECFMEQKWILVFALLIGNN